MKRQDLHDNGEPILASGSNGGNGTSSFSGQMSEVLLADDDDPDEEITAPGPAQRVTVKAMIEAVYSLRDTVNEARTVGMLAIDRATTKMESLIRWLVASFVFFVIVCVLLLWHVVVS